jgi:branched-chain amino acid aminotransferase
VTLPKFAYFQGQIVPYSEAKVGVLTHALNYGTAAFGGIRSYWNDTEHQLFMFRPQDHYRRLLNSARLLHMTLSHGYLHPPVDLQSRRIHRGQAARAAR